MASGHLTALIGRTHGCTDQQRDVKILLANSEPSTHGTPMPSGGVHPIINRPAVSAFGQTGHRIDKAE